jgi:hypothetical protein
MDFLKDEAAEQNFNQQVLKQRVLRYLIRQVLQ